MTPEIYTIIAVAIALAGLILNGQRAMAAAVTELRREFRGEMNDLRSEMHREFTALREQISSLSERVARLEGILGGPRETAVGEGA